MTALSDPWNDPGQSVPILEPDYQVLEPDYQVPDPVSDTVPKFGAALRKKTKVDLIAWILERAETCQDTQRALSAWVAPETDRETLKTSLRKQIGSTWAKVKRSRNAFRMAYSVAGDLEPVLAGIESLIERGEAEEAEKLLRTFSQACEPHAGHIDDSHGQLWPVLQEGVVLWGRAWAGIKTRDPQELALMVKDGVLENPYSIRDHMIRDFAEALGEGGLQILLGMLREQYEADRGASLERYQQERCLRHIADVADALGDPDLFIEAHTLGGQQEIYSLPIGRRLLDAGRHKDALMWLERALESGRLFHREREDAPTLIARTLVAMGRNDDAHEMLWGEFERTLNPEALLQAAALVPEAERAALQTRALECAEKHHRGLSAAGFLVEHGQTTRAGDLVVADPSRFPGSLYPQVTRLATAFEHEHPAAAWYLHRNLVDDILGEARSSAYSHAAKYLAKMGGLAGSAGLGEVHARWESQVQVNHGRKRSFWRHVTS